MHTIRLLALDLDGTLLDGHGRVPPAHARAVRLAQQRGVTIALCSGRGLADTRLFSAQLEAPADWAVTANGADVRALAGGAPVFEGGLTRPLCETLLHVCADCGGEPCFYTCAHVYYGAAFERFLHAVREGGGRRMQLDELDSYIRVQDAAGWRETIAREDGAITKAILYHDTPQQVDAMGARLAQTGLFELAPSIMFGGRLKNIEVNRAGINKGVALAALAAHLGLSPRSIMAVGDSDNDLAMLRMAGLGVAMADSPAHVRAAADAVTDRPNTENGLAEAIERYILHPDGRRND